MALDTELLAKSLLNAQQRWVNPHPGFASGFDIRSSDNALLVLFYGDLVKASNYNWLNAGRRLIDKTWCNILLDTHHFEQLGSVTGESVATALEAFIIEQLKPRWQQINSEQTDNSSLTDDLVMTASQQLFGSITHLQAASYFLFYLLPQLPVYPVGPENAALSYAEYASAYRELLLQLKSTEIPVAHFGDSDQIKLIDDLLQSSDWWQRRILMDIGVIEP